MQMTTSIILVLVFLGLALMLTSRLSSGGKKGKKTTRKATTEKVRRNPYQAVSIRYGTNACDAAREIKDKRFRVAEAPLTPLPECTRATDCSCKYVRHDDRRSNQGDRRLPVALSSELFERTGRVNRRQRVGRRSSDWGLAQETS
jgi:hypothetical protein